MHLMSSPHEKESSKCPPVSRASAGLTMQTLCAHRVTMQGQGQGQAPWQPLSINANNIAQLSEGRTDKLDGLGNPSNRLATFPAKSNRKQTPVLADSVAASRLLHATAHSSLHECGFDRSQANLKQALTYIRSLDSRGQFESLSCCGTWDAIWQH